ncbi:MAG TPA: hypothetical protein VEC36_08405 [Patescibacteria group bacterium]|nr:hypothetical protein [Patescibacteria group bacterium]
MNAIIQTPTGNLTKSRAFYETLGFKNITGNIFTDGKALIEINNARTARAGYRLFKNSWKEEIELLKNITPVHEHDGEHFITDQSGTFIYLTEGDPPVSFTPEEASYSTLGNYMGLSLETTDMPKSTEVLKILGFMQTMGAPEQGWVLYVGFGGFGVSMLNTPCPHMFFNPSMTYFNGKNNLTVIEKIRSLKIPITEEITEFNKEGMVDNVIIRDPGGYGFFIFSD